MYFYRPHKTLFIFVYRVYFILDIDKYLKTIEMLQKKSNTLSAMATQCSRFVRTWQKPTKPLTSLKEKEFTLSVSIYLFTR